jgi:hypothetical protein
MVSFDTFGGGGNIRGPGLPEFRLKTEEKRDPFGELSVVGRKSISSTVNVSTGVYTAGWPVSGNLAGRQRQVDEVQYEAGQPLGKNISGPMLAKNI